MRRVAHMIICGLVAALGACSATTPERPQSSPAAAVGNWMGHDLSAFDSLSPARDLLTDCEAEAADSAPGSGACSFYLAGVFEALALENLGQMEDAQMRTCPPNGPVGVAELRRIFIDYGQAHRDQLGEHRIWTVSAAFHAAYPCR